MKITVNNAREKELFEKFKDFLADYIDSKEMQELMKNADYSFETHEIDFLQTGLNYNDVVIDKTVWQITIPSDNLTGTCRYCGGQWQGIEDVSEVNIYDCERFLNLDEDESYHAECYRENQCVSCGSDEETMPFKDEGMLCEDCCENWEDDKE